MLYITCHYIKIVVSLLNVYFDLYFDYKYLFKLLINFFLSNFNIINLEFKKVS